MPIDAFQEQIMTFAQAAKILPRKRAGKKTHVCTVYRWASRGIRGVALETIRVGGTTCTSREALQRFFDALTGPKKQPTDDQPSRGRKKAIIESERFLKEEMF